MTLAILIVKYVTKSVLGHKVFVNFTLDRVSDIIINKRYKGLYFLRVILNIYLQLLGLYQSIFFLNFTFCL